MKKVFVTMMAVCLTASLWAVDLPNQGLGLQIGWAQPTLRVNDSNSPDTLNHHFHMNGFKVGLIYDASYIAGFGSSMGLNYTFGVYNGGWNQRNADNTYPQDRQLITYNELEIFVDWQYKFEVAKETYLILYTGPTIQCGLGLSWRKDTRTDVIDPVTHLPTDEIITTRGDRMNAYNADGEDGFKRLNVTWGVGAGFQYKRYFLRGGYDFGLINPHKVADYSTGVHSRGRLDQWSIKIGMYIWYAE
jgi:hypothetical protein